MVGLSGNVPVAHKVMLFYSDYHFLPEGFRVIKIRFDQQMSAEKVYSKLDYNQHDSCFEVTCEAPDSDNIWRIFQKLHNDIIRTEISDGYDFDSKLMAKINSPNNEKENDGEFAGAETSSPEEEVSFRVRGSWECKDESLKKMIPQEVLLEIAAITRTRLVGDLSNQTIHIYAQCQEDCERVARKFCVLQKYYYLARRFGRHIFFTEGKADFELRMPILSEVHNRPAGKTLLDPIYAALRYEDLTKIRIVRCCPYSNIRGTYKMMTEGKIFPAVPEGNVGITLRQWPEYHYPPRGNDSRSQKILFQHSTAESLQIGNNVRRLLEIRVLHNTGEVQNGTDSIQEVENQDSYDLTNSQGDILIDFDTAGEITSSPLLEKRNEDHPGFTQGRRSIHRIAGMRDLRKSSLSNGEIKLATNQSTAPQLIPGKDNKSAPYQNEIQKTSRSLWSLIDNETIATERRGLALVKPEGPPRLGDLKSAKTALKTVNEEDELDGQVQSNGIETHMANVSIFAADVREHREGVSMSQPIFVAFENVPIENGTKEFFKDMEESAYTILNSVRNYSGNITLKCHFGQLLMKPSDAVVMHSLKKKLTYPANVMKDILQKSFKKVDFTKILTCLPADVDFILGMKIEETKQRIWSEILQESAVMYEFICCEHRDPEEVCATSFVVEIDADSFTTRVRSPLLNFGKVMVHCTLRTWDYVISADGARNLGKKYGDIAHAIKESMYIAPNSERLSMSFELDRNHRVHFRSIRARRRIQYKSYDGRTLLNITEVRSLMQRCEASELGNIYFVFECEDPNSIWYEVDMESVEARIAFKENLSLELADETDWRADLLVQSGVVVKDLCVPANYIVAKIDGVGFYNENGIEVNAAPSVIDPSTLPEKQRPGYHFW